jgi:hypothetical protein
MVALTSNCISNIAPIVNLKVVFVFGRETKLLTFLNRSSDAAICGLENACGKRFIILDYVEVQTLQHSSNKEPLIV